MKTLNVAEIANIARLLLSPDSKNVQLALSLLKHHQYALPSIKDQVLIFALFNPQETELTTWLATAFPNLALQKHPVYPLAAAFLDSNYIRSLPDVRSLKPLLEEQQKYESYIVANLERAVAYKQLAAQLKKKHSEHPDLVLFYFRKARKYLPDDPEVAFNLAHTLHYDPSPLEKVDDYTQEVVEGYLKAYALHPLAKALYAIASFYQDEVGDNEQANRYYKRCIETHPNYPFAYNGWADLLLSEKKYIKAKELALKGLELIPSDRNKEHILDSLGYIEWKGFNNYQKAEVYFSKAVEINPHHWESIIGAADMFFEIKDYSNAVKWYEVALNRKSRNMNVLKKLVFLYEQLDQINAAISHYQKMLQIVPNLPFAVQALKRLNN